MIDFNKLKQVHEIANNVSKKEKYYYIDIEMQTLYLSDTPACFCFNLEVCSGEGVFKYYELSLDELLYKLQDLSPDTVHKPVDINS